MVAREFGDGLIHPLLQQILIAEQAMADVARPVETQRTALGPVRGKNAIGADVMKQTADDDQMFVDEPRGNRAPRDASGRRDEESFRRRVKAFDVLG